MMIVDIGLLFWATLYVATYVRPMRFLPVYVQRGWVSKCA